ncbi:MAG: hypothetical protein N2376_05135, partial [Clostridia bacterium]|nr:hypothetical protein [Clostridia bacterium]
MQYPDVQEAVFLERPNRFIAHCNVDGQRVKTHVRNTGRCAELLIPGAPIAIQRSADLTRKTAYSLI